MTKNVDLKIDESGKESIYKMTRNSDDMAFEAALKEALEVDIDDYISWDTIEVDPEELAENIWKLAIASERKRSEKLYEVAERAAMGECCCCEDSFKYVCVRCDAMQSLKDYKENL